MVVELAERLASFGRWRAFTDGRQEWSEGLHRITGFPDGCMPDQQTLRALLPDDGKRFYGCLQEHAADTEPFSFEFAIDRVDGERRTLRVIAQNMFEAEGELSQRLGVAIDVTDDQRIIDRLGEACGEAMRRVEEALALAETDPLTALPNRRRVMAEIDRAILTARRTGRPPALILFNIDHFKGVNDRYGHAAGDAVLVQIGKIARRECRESDLVGRIGGEEFLWLLADASVAEARAAAERLRRSIERDSAAGGAPPVTASLGLAHWKHGEGTLNLFARADAALYGAKGAGRNRVRKAA